MSQMFQRRPSRDASLYLSLSANTMLNNSMSINNNNIQSSTSLGKSSILTSSSSEHPLYIVGATDESEDDRVNLIDEAGTMKEDQDEIIPDDDEEYDDSGHEDDEDLVASEEILLPEEEEDNEEEADSEEDFDEDNEPPQFDEESLLFQRQLSYPPLPQYNPPETYQDHSDLKNTSTSSSPTAATNSSTPTPASRRPPNPRERLGVLTPMEEVTEPPSSAGTEASGIHKSRRRKRSLPPSCDNNTTGDNRMEGGSRTRDKKSILKSKSPTGSPERRVKFVGAGSITPSERTTSPAESIASNTSEYSSMVDSGRKTGSGYENQYGSGGGGGAIPEETEDDNEEDNQSPNSNHNNTNANYSNLHDQAYPSEETDEPGLGSLRPTNGSKLPPPVMEHFEKVETWQLGSDGSNDDTPLSALDSEFPSILDDIIAELHSWDRLAGTGAGVTEINASRQDHLANVSSQLASYLGQVSPATVTTNLPQIIPLVTTLLSVTEMNFRAQLTSLNTVNILINRLRDCKAHSGLKVLPNADLTWLIRTLCDISSDSSRSILKSEGTAALANLVKAAGPEMISEPILFILMGNDEKIKKTFRNREGSGNVVTTGAPGGAPKIKATALDTLTFALLTFPRDNFDLDIVAKLACHCLLHSKRRVRQAALECLAVVSHSMGSKHALPMFRQFISEEEEQLLPPMPDVNASNSSISSSNGSGSGSGPPTITSSQELILRPAGPPSRIPVPIKSLQPQVPEQLPPLVSAVSRPPPGGPSPSSAVSARISRHVLPSPSQDELVEYAVKIPAKCQVLNRQSVKIGSQKGLGSGDSGSGSGGHSGSAVVSRSSGSERLSSSGESNSSISNIDYSLLELEPVLNSHGSGVGQRRRAGNGGKNSSSDSVMAADILWILSGSGPVKKYDPASRFPKEPNSLNRSTSQQLITPFNNSSGTESDFNSSSQSQRTASSSDFNMRRVTKADLQIQDSLMKDPVLGRYYYPPPTHLSPRGPLNSSDSLSSRLSARSSFGLLPNKYSILKNSHPSPHHQLHLNSHDLLPHNTLMPGAYESSFRGDLNGYDTTNGSNWSNGHPDYGNYTRMSRTQPIQPVSSLREKFFDSSKRNRGFEGQGQNPSFRSDSPTTEEEREENEESESENEKTEPEIERNGNDRQRSTTDNRNNQEGRKSVNKIGSNVSNGKNENGNQIKDGLMTGGKNGLVNRANDELTSIRKHGEEFAKGVTREYQVYHHRIEVEPTGPAAAAAAAALASSMSTKRGDVDSAGSNNTRDSGVSLGSLKGTKSPPSAQTTPPSLHRTSGAGAEARPNGVSAKQQRSTKSKPTSNKGQLNRAWQSTPDVPTLSDTDDGEPGFGNSRRNHSGSTTQFDQRLQANQVQAQTSSSEGIMLLHRKPVLARRGQSVGRIPVPDTDELETMTMPQIRYPVSNRQLGSNTRSRKGSGDRFSSQANSIRDTNQHSRRGEGPVAYTYGNDGSVTPMSPTKMRNSVSTGNLIDEDQDPGGRLSKSTYLEITDEDQPPISSRRGRLSQRNNGPFGEVQASTSDFNLDRSSVSQTLPRRNGAPKVNGKIVPTKVYKGSFREVNSRKGSNGSNTEVFPLDLKPVTSAKHALPVALQQLQSTEWETNVEGFRQIVRIIRYNPETIRADLHNVNITGIRHLTNLRSQVCRSAILCFKEMFTQLGKSMEADSEKIAEKLLDKSSDTNKFIREDSGKTLDAMIENLTPSKGLTCLDLFGTRHRNPAVRCMAAKMTTKLVQSLGAERCLTELPERLLPMLCKLLQEGGLETRTAAKTAVSILMTHPSFNTLLRRHVPSDILRNAQKSIDSLQK